MLTPSGDGSKTLYSEQFGQHYHSVYGARTESERVFVDLGLRFISERYQELNVFEMGFGTGLNAWLTGIYALNQQKTIKYTGLEAFPLTSEVYEGLDTGVRELHHSPWEEVCRVNDFFLLRKVKGRLEAFETEERFHLVFFDAFAPEAQPELWTEDIFNKMYNLLESGGVLTTYCSKSYVQKNLRAAGFIVEKHPGPPRKREIIRAIKA